MNMRSFWWLALGFTLLWIWMEWSQFSAQKSLEAQKMQAQTTEVPAAQSAPQSQTQADVPMAANSDKPSVQSVPSTQPTAPSKQRIHVKTDVLAVEIDTYGGDIRKVDLLKYGASNDRNQPFQLMGDQGQMYYVAQNGIAKLPDAKLPAPTHKDVYKAQKVNYTLHGNTLTVPLVWEKAGVKVTKTYTFTQGEYTVKLDYKVENNSDKPWSGSLYSQLVRNRYDPDHNSFMYTYTGPVIYDPLAEDKYVKHPFDELDKQPVSVNTQGGWVAMIQHYFISAAIPHQDQKNMLYAKALGEGKYAAGVVQPVVTIPPQQSADLNSELYLGPIIQDKLAQIAPGLERTVDYGVLTFIAEPIFWLLEKIHNVVGNWGWSIILLTILIKLLFYKLSEASYRSMAKMKKFSPKLKQLKENYGDNKELFQKKMMELYREEKINPLGGCLPILVQMPVFIALYWVLLYSAEMRQAPWIGWIQDLSSPDPYYILPVIMGVTMYIQQKLNPSDMMDEMQQKVMRLLPFIFTIFFAFFPAGLVLYWVVNNILSVAQQWYITRKIEKGEAAK
ncbi:membrane protein insertase YidC [Galenea microaerophila]